MITTRKPDQEGKLYMRIMFREFFFGPFADLAAVGNAMSELDAKDDCWDYDGVCVIYGKNPLPEDFVYGFDFVTKKEREKIELIRN